MLIMIKGSVPGNNGSEVVLKPSVKKLKMVVMSIMELKVLDKKEL